LIGHDPSDAAPDTAHNKTQQMQWTIITLTMANGCHPVNNKIINSTNESIRTLLAHLLPVMHTMEANDSQQNTNMITH